MKFLKPLAVAFLLPATFSSLHAESNFNATVSTEIQSILRQDTLAWTSPLPFDKDVKVGKLKNGFTYYIRRNTEPEKRVTMYLPMKVGSILETEEERGLAHFLEHMNFNGLKNFPKNELVDYLQKAGVRFGSDLNAYTGFNETVYQLPIPSDDPELLKNGLQVMRDWAQDAMLQSDEIDKERGIIMEEMRGGRGAGQRIQDQMLPVLFNGSLYSERLPIGTEKVVMGFDHKLIRDFKDRWYRPDLQSIIIVGDVDPQEMEKEVVRLFSDMKVVKKPVVRKDFGIDLLNKNQFKVITDPEMPQTIMRILIKHPKTQVRTVADYRTSLLEGVFNEVINARLREIAQKPESPFLQGFVAIDNFMSLLQTMMLAAVPKPGQLEESTKTVFRELKRFEHFGITETEFQRAIAMYAKSNETAYQERDKVKSDNYVNKYLEHFLRGDAALSIEDEYNLVNQLLPTLTLKEVEATGNKYYAETNRDIIIVGPEKDKEKMPSEAVVDKWLADVNAEKLTAYEDQVSDLPLLSSEPAKGAITSTKSIDAIGSKELTLSNGVKVVLKPTNFKNDQILISASSDGGHSLYEDKDYFAASNAASLVNASGVGQLNAVEIRKYLTSKNVRISPYISERNEGLSGSTDKEGLKTAFEMIHGYFTQPRLDDDIFQGIVSQIVASMENRENEPRFVFQSAINKALYGNNIRKNAPNPEDIQAIDKNRTLEIFKERFADASDFTFTIVGSFSEEDIKPYLEQYLGSLPSTNRKEQARDLKILPPTKGLNVVVNKGKEAKAQVSMAFLGDYTYSEDENINMDALESVLSIKLLERLREDESGVYGTGASASYSKFPTGRYSFNIGFGTSLDKYESLINSALDEIAKVKKNGPTQVDLDKFIIEKTRQYELDLKENNFWLGEISSAYRLKEDPTETLKYLDKLKKVNVSSVKAVAEKYLKEDRLFKFILLPEESK
ncbi:zinc protease [Sphingobacterium alimentarium]|uniref:Zinc protease n=1 Tax=Sphingobacterium alimentarium TaxID=797292 RepID=A0A4R3VY21_9SPHI|nr:M16 family metallopeptidase [Sphingobacterium alimentarium]TCV14031.1 zinc protease [Sphingobacterium alimentarium]